MEKRITKKKISLGVVVERKGFSDYYYSYCHEGTWMYADSFGGPVVCISNAVFPGIENDKVWCKNDFVNAIQKYLSKF